MAAFILLLPVCRQIPFFSNGGSYVPQIAFSFCMNVYKMFPARDGMFSFYSTTKAWGEGNIWQRAGGMHRGGGGRGGVERKTKECVRGDLSVLGFMAVFFQTACAFWSWITAALSQQAQISKRRATCHKIKVYAVKKKKSVNVNRCVSVGLILFS